MYIRRIISTIFLLALIVTTARAQNLGTEKKDFILHFRFDRSLVDSGYRNNNHTLRALQELLSDSLTAAEIDTPIPRPMATGYTITLWHVVVQRP